MAEVNPLVAKLDRRYRELKSSRSNWENHWQQLADYMLPRKADIVKKRTQGDKRTELIFDGTAIHAVELLASSLHGMLTSPSTPWFSMRFRDPALQQDDAANEWLEVSLDQMYQALVRHLGSEKVGMYYSDALFVDKATELQKQVVVLTHQFVTV